MDQLEYDLLIKQKFCEVCKEKNKNICDCYKMRMCANCGQSAKTDKKLNTQKNVIRRN